MSSDLKIINDILYLHLRPWKTRYSDQKYQQMLQMVNKETYRQQPLCAIDFIKPLTAKTKYYHAVIENHLINYLNSIHFTMANAISENEKKYWIHKALLKELKPKFNAVEKIILNKKYFFDSIDPKNKSRSHDVTFCDQAYIIQFLKYKLIWIYLEIQGGYLPYLSEDSINEEHIHYLHFSEEVPKELFIIDAPEMQLKKPSNSSIVLTQPEQLPVIMADVREAKKGILNYSEIIKDSERFAKFENKLFEEGLISIGFEFKNEHGQKKELAAAYQVLINNDYFNKMYHPGRRKITDRHIRQFLNYRYLAKIDKESRVFGNKKNGAALLEKYFIKKPWLTLDELF